MNIQEKREKQDFSHVTIRSVCCSCISSKPKEMLLALCV